jgi:hypothetical protein
MHAQLYLAKSLAVSCATVDGSCFVIHEKRKAILELNDVGAAVWGLISGTRSVDAIIAECMRIYEAPLTDISSGVNSFLEELLQLEVIVQSDSPFDGIMAYEHQPHD